MKAANTRRAAHCSPPLRLDPELTRLAQKRADEICRTENFAATRSQFRGKSLGETLYKWESTEPIDLDSRPGKRCSIRIFLPVKMIFVCLGSEPVNRWYSEKKNYDFENPGFSKETSSFTQLIWAYSKLVGFGVCLSNDEQTMFVVGKYSPGGNDAGIFESNVQSTSCE